MSVTLVYITVENNSRAKEIASALLERRLIACANILPGMISLYRWEGKLQTAEECVLIVKTTEKQLETLTETVKSLHSYDCPCIVALPASGGYSPFLQWVEQETCD